MPAIIDNDECIACHECVNACPQDVFFGSKEGQVPVVTYPELCYYCNSCVDECPVEGAIRLRIPLPLMIPYK